MLSLEAVAQSLCRKFAGGIAGESEGLDYGQAEERISECIEDQRERTLSDVMRVVAKGELGDEGPNRIEDRVQCVAIAAEDHPGGKCAGSLLSEGVETLVNDDPRIRFAGARPIDGLGDTAVDRVCDGFCKFALEASCGAEMVEQVGMSAADFSRHRLEGHSLRAALDQQSSRRGERGGAAFFGGEARSSY